MTLRSVTRLTLAIGIAGAALSVGGPALAEEEEAQPVALPWMAGPMTAAIGDLAEIDFGDGYVFLDGDGTRRLMDLTQNPVSGNELATISPASDEENWFVIFEFESIGYVEDDEKEDLDADAILSSVREGTAAANDERRARGWGPLEIVGWHEKPHYDERTKNLSWAIIGKSEDSGTSINRIVKLLGRRGVMTATLVAAPEDMAAAVPLVDGLIQGYRYKPGNTYAEYVPGSDKLAEYGLAALVVGGAGAALVKSGLLAKLWKPIAIGLVALGVGMKRLLFGGRKAQQNLEGPIA